MASAASASTNRIDQAAREIAMDLARRSGLSLTGWASQIAQEDRGGPYGDPPGRHEPSSQVSAAPVRFRPPARDADDLARVIAALDRLGARVQAAEQRTTLAIGGVEQSVAGLVSRLEASEREQTAIAARLEGVADDLRGEHAQLTQRLEQVEACARAAELDPTPSAADVAAQLVDRIAQAETQTGEAFDGVRDELDLIHEQVGALNGEAAAAFEAAVGRMAGRIDRTDALNVQAMRALQCSLGALNERLAAVEARSDEPISGAEVEHLKVELWKRLDAAKAGMAAQVQEGANRRLDGMERGLRDLTGRIGAAEQRAATGAERIGQQLARTAESLTRRIEDGERRSMETIGQLGGEVVRVGEVVTTKLAQADVAGDVALERLSAKIVVITKGLSRRIGKAESRMAKAVDELGERVDCVCDWLEEHQETLSSEIAERIRRSDERTAKLLDDLAGRVASPPSAAVRAVPAALADPSAAAPPAIGMFNQSAIAPRRPSTPIADPASAPAGPAAPSTVEIAAKAGIAPVDVAELDLFGPPESSADKAAGPVRRHPEAADDLDLDPFDDDLMGDQPSAWTVAALEQIERARTARERPDSGAGGSTFEWLMRFGQKPAGVKSIAL